MKKFNEKYAIPVIVILLIIIVFQGWLWYRDWVMVEFQDYVTRGQFGDMFGALNALFTGLAFAGVVITILLQREDSIAQKQQIRDQQKETKHQRFEDTYFNLINLRAQNLNALTTKQGHGLQLFRDYVSTLKRQIGSVQYDEKSSAIGGINIFDYGQFRIAHYKIYNVIPYIYNSYNSNLVAILEFIDKSTLIDKDDKPGYMEKLIDLLSEYERVFLFYHIALSIKAPHHRINVRLYKIYKDYQLSEYIGDVYFNTSHAAFKNWDNTNHLD